MSQPLLIGHRGARGLAPENTLRALEAGILAGAPWLEFDVQRHPSGELFLLHDLSLDRSTNGRGLPGELSWEALRALDAGLGERLPTLDEALDLIDQRAGVNIELKTWDGTAAAVAAKLRERVAAGWPLEQLLVSSFHLPELFEFHQLAPEIPVGALLCGVPLDWAACASELQATSLNLSSEFVDARLVADAKSRGLAVYVYTVNDPEEYRRLAALGIDGVFTDYPDRLLALAT
ncbi:MAG: glycerophosphodiester phosphodiesterase [Nevskiaceae bacterium]|nr:MAG: glycerophosphodiester phosphodiesterase [Nevskiaceae bacterium]TAM30480.1 MAG: glycerophosphodiester phosphodiesterase [Nevskiaceae bacterium]